ncbi:MAG TPA: O-antigen ligase family protein [Candidatus Saccharimonadales bacterium]|nr:O-antigen ligase family protein [Candidatus Saccharimonadales bacterium]
MSPFLVLTILTFILIAFCVLLFYRHISLGIAAFIIALPFERIGAYPLNPATGYPLLHPAQIVGVALIGAYFLRWIMGLERPRNINSLPWLLLFLATSAISAFMAHSQEVWQILIWLFFITTLFWVVANLAANTSLANTRRLLAITVIIVSIFGIYQFFGDLAGLPNSVTGIRDRYSKSVLGFPRLQSTALEPLYFANYLFLPLFVLFAVLISESRRDRLTWVALGLGLTAFALTFSRGAFISAIAGLLVLAVLLRQRLKGWAKAHLVPIIAILAATILVLVLIVAVSVNHTKNHGGTSILKDYFTLKTLRSGSATERFRDQKLAIDIYKQHPVFGVGIGGFGSAYYGCRVGKCVYRPNNQALEVLAEGGIIGFITFHIFLLSVLYYGWRALKRTTGEHHAMIAGLMAAEVAMIVQSQTFSGFLCCLTYTWATLALLAGLSTSSASKREKAVADATAPSPS